MSHLQTMKISSAKSQKYLNKTVRGVALTKYPLIVSTDGQIHFNSLLRLASGDKIIGWLSQNYDRSGHICVNEAMWFISIFHTCSRYFLG